MIIPYQANLYPLTKNRHYETTFEFPFDLTGCKVRMQIRTKQYVDALLIVEPLMTIESTTETKSIVKCVITKEQTADIPVTENPIVCYYEVVLSENDKPQTYVKGSIQVVSNLSENPEVEE